MQIIEQLRARENALLADRARVDEALTAVRALIQGIQLAEQAKSAPAPEATTEAQPEG